MSGMVSDGQQGAIVWWEFNHYIPEFGGGTIVETAQRIDVLGNVPAPWPAGGVAVQTWSSTSVSRSIYPIALITDAAGGAFYAEKIFSYDGGEPRTRFNLHRIAANGSVTGVPNYSGPLTGPIVGGLPVVVDADGAGGVTFMTGNPLYTQRVTPAGNNLWAWPRLSHASLVGTYVVLADGTGGAFFAWSEQPAGGLPTLYVQHFDAAGSVAPGWPLVGRAVRSVAGNIEKLMLAPNGVGGVFVVWEDLRGGQRHLFASGVLADGSLAPGIPADGRPLGSPQTTLATVMSDEQGGLFVVRKSSDGLRLHRLDAALLASTGWAAEGMLLDASSQECGIVADGDGGAFIALYSDGPVYPHGLIGQHLSGDGSPAPGWTSDGYLLSPTGYSPRIVRSGDGAIVAWAEYDSDRPGAGGIYAQRLVPDGPVAVQLSLVGANAEPGNVSLHWYATGAAMLAATVERRSENGEWTALGAVSADGAGHLRYEDGSVASGRFGYRVTWTEDGTVRHAGEAWVDVPDAWRLALSAPRPNPGSGPASFAVTLAERSAASLELVDLQGRRVAHRDIGALGAGRHTITIDEAATLAPGVYLARLSQGVDTRTVRMIRVR
jgi:hypothetical protein